MQTPRKRLLLLAVLGSLFLSAPLAANAEAKPSTGRPIGPAAPAKADRDGDGIFDELAARLDRADRAAKLDVIVTLDDPASLDRIASLRSKVGGFTVTRRFEIVDGFAAKLTKGQIQALVRIGGVRHVEENSTVRALNDDAQSGFGVTKARIDVPSLDGNADANPNTYSPADLVAAVIDTGIDPGHLDLDEGKVLGFKDFVNGGTAPYDDEGHGTHVAATIAGDGDARADRLYRGVAPGAGLVGVKVLDSGGFGSEADIISGIQWVVQNKSTFGIEAINLSLGIEGCSAGTDATSLAVNSAHDAGLVLAVAAGNEGPGTCTIGSPGAAAKALTVGASADPGENGFFQAWFSSRGPTADGRVKPDVSAPGWNITSALAGTTAGYFEESGTSMATPFTAGVALLMRDATPSLTPQQVKDKITGTAIDWGRGGDNRTSGTTGPDIDYGAGRLDAYAALRSAGANLNAPPTMPAHELRQGTLSNGAMVEYDIDVTSTLFPIAATLIIPSISGAWAANPDFDLFLFDPSGAEVASSEFQTRQEDLGWQPTQTGRYRLRVLSYRGSGGFFVDISRPSLPAYQVPRSASPISVSLVPAFSQCSTGANPANAAHSPPLGGPACIPAKPTSTIAATGSTSQGSAQVAVIPGNLATQADEADVSFDASLSDVRSGSPLGGDYDPNPGGTDVTLLTTFRLTDMLNGPTQQSAGTTTNVDFAVPVTCVGTAGAEGSSCAAHTSADAVLPASISEHKSSVMQLFRVRLEDSGLNGVRGDADDRLLAQQGIYVP
jgi:serine protease AprX